MHYRPTLVCVAVLKLGMTACSPETSPIDGETADAGTFSANAPSRQGGQSSSARTGSAGIGGSTAHTSGSVEVAMTSGRAGAASAGRAGSASGVAGTPSATPSSSGGAAGAAGAAGSASGGADACVSLSACCSSVLDSVAKALCQGVANNRAEDLCSTASAEYCSAPPIPKDCAQLAACCVRTEDDAEDCQLIADAAVAADCVAAAPDFCAPPQTPPMSPGDACAALTTCCATLSDDEDREDCDGVVDAAVASECTATLGELCPTTPTTPTTPDVATCTTLDATCCGKLEDEEDVEECATAARTGDPATCQEAYDALCGEESD